MNNVARFNKKKYLCSAKNGQYIDRYGQFHELPKYAVRKKRIGVFGITLSCNNKVLVTSPPHAPDMSGLPGGGREGSETHGQTLQREYFEEVGSQFVIKNRLYSVHQHRVLYYAQDKNEYWQYDQFFYFTRVHHPKMPSTWWSTPEGGRANWIPLSEYHRITATHIPAIEQLLKQGY